MNYGEIDVMQGISMQMCSISRYEIYLEKAFLRKGHYSSDLISNKYRFRGYDIELEILIPVSLEILFK